MFIGIDVSKSKLDVYSNEFKIFANTDDGIKDLSKYLESLNPELIGFEATGGLELKMLYFLAEKGFKLSSINPKQVRDFAKASGKLAKTDKIDAKVIAKFVEVFNPPLVNIPDGETIELNGFVVRRKQLIDILVSEKNRYSSCSSKASKQSLRKHIKWLEKEINSLEDNINNLLKKSPEWKEKEDILKSVPGVGNVLTFNLLSGLTELGKLNSRQISALVGLAPMNKDSGKFRGKRFTQGGRIDVRTSLYMPTLSAIRNNSVIKAFYDKLIKAGKPPKVAITACMHKLLIILNAMVKKSTKWNEKYTNISI